MISYSGLTNYGKTSFPVVQGWNGSMNIKRDPPKSITTKRRETVFDTNDITKTLAISDDRISEALNFYARGVNPMVSVSYGEGQTNQQTSARGQSYLPYRIMKDGAFRLPIKRQQDLLPLSRLPREFTTVKSNPAIVDLTKRLIELGTCESTPQVRNELRTIECQLRKIYFESPELIPPTVVNFTRDDPLVSSFRTNVVDTKEQVMVPEIQPQLRYAVCAPLTTSVYDPRVELTRDKPPKYELENLVVASGRTNARGTNEKVVEPKYELEKLTVASGRTNASGTNEKVVESKYELENLLVASGRTNARGTNEKVVEPEIQPQLRSTHQAVSVTNKCGIGKITNIDNVNFNLREKISPGGFDGRPGIPVDRTK